MKVGIINADWPAYRLVGIGRSFQTGPRAPNPVDNFVAGIDAADQGVLSVRARERMGKEQVSMHRGFGVGRANFADHDCGGTTKLCGQLLACLTLRS